MTKESRNITRWITPILLAAVALAGLPASAQTVTINVTDVNTSNGRVMASLCGDPAGAFPGMCNTAAAMADAKEGLTTLTFPNVQPGTYALQVFHDENGDMIPNIPPEGYAFGNDAGFPPSFKAASFTVAGDTTHAVRMNYLTQFGAAAPTKPVEKGAPAPAGVAKTIVRDEGLLGAFYMPEGSGRRPALLVLGGSEGGLGASSGVGLSFTKEGYAVLALAFFDNALKGK